MAGWKVWGAPDELAFEYIDGDKHVCVSIDPITGIGYTLRRGDKFEPGKFTMDNPEAVANEINSYLAETN